MANILLKQTPTAPHVFIDLTDTPAAYAGKANHMVKVNAGETALVFLKFEYDVDYMCYVVEY